MKNLQIIASLITGTVGCLFILIGESTPQWVTYDSFVSIGLFVVCKQAPCESYSAEGSVLAARSLVVIGFLTSVIGLIVLIVYYIKHARKDTAHRTLSMVIAVAFIIAALTALIGAIIFATTGKSELELILGVSLHLGYSFALTIVGSVFSGAAGALTLVHRLGIQN